MIRQALILAGGLGTRLGELTETTPKPVLNVAGQPFLAYLLWNLKRRGVTHVVMSVGYLAERIQELVGDGAKYGLTIEYVVEAERLGTGGGIRFAAHLLDEVFFVLNGDTMFDFNYQDLTAYLSADCEAAMGLRRIEDASRYGSVRLVDGRIRAFEEKKLAGHGVISGGVYLLRKRVLDLLPEGRSSIERELFPRLAQEGTLGGAVYDGYFLDIGLPETLEAAQSELPAWQSMIQSP